ncbi:MAG TPA: glutathione S-transferase [Caulobacteraceae bacterium]
MTITLSGAPGSPYTRKMLGVLRYRRIAYRFLLSGSAAAQAMPQPKVRLLPTFYLPDEGGELRAVTDSTPLIRRLEREVEGRSIIPSDPALRFLDELIEDYADEWLTKAMFHYRWAHADDADQAGRVLPCWVGMSMPNEALAPLQTGFAQRQIGRLGVMGSNAVTGPVIEASYRRFLEAFEAHLSVQPFMLGQRPAACDFAVFGQLTQLAGFDPTPMRLTAQVAPRVMAWVGVMEDLSGPEPAEDGWNDPAALPATLMGLLAEMGRTYAPVMAANARALMAGETEVRAEVDGQPWTQQPFPYQAKCLGWLREAHGALPDAARERVDPLLAEAGLSGLFA